MLDDVMLSLNFKKFAIDTHNNTYILIEHTLLITIVNLQSTVLPFIV